MIYSFLFSASRTKSHELDSPIECRGSKSCYAVVKPQIPHGKFGCTVECGGTPHASSCKIYVRPILDAQAVRRVGIVMMSFHWTVLTDKDLKSLDSERSEVLQ